MKINFNEWLLENKNITYTMYTGISKASWENIWKDKSLKDKYTNLTTDFNFAMDYSYDFETGKYDDLVVEISNIPIDAFIAYRNKNYADDDDYKDMINLSLDKKISLLNKKSLFIADLYKYKDQISIKLIS